MPSIFKHLYVYRLTFFNGESMNDCKKKKTQKNIKKKQKNKNFSDSISKELLKDTIVFVQRNIYNSTST